MEEFGGAVLFIVGLVIAIGIALAIREVVCWYLKINRGLELLEDIHYELQAMRADAETAPPPSPRVRM